MSERGVFGVDRGIWEHPLFQDRGAEFSKREAWLWLVSEAAWKPRKSRVAAIIVDLRRGQLAHSLRYMAEVWGWKLARVDRFIERLKTETMIETATDTGITVITICKYNTYQRVGLPTETPNETPTETPARQDRDSTETIAKKENIIGGHGGGSAEAIVSRLVTPEAGRLATELAAIAGHPDPMSWPPGWCGSPMRVQAMLSSGWHADIIRSAVQSAASRKRDGPAGSLNYFEKAIARAHAQQADPLPTVEIRESETTYVNRPQRQNNIIDAADRLIGSINAFGPRPGGDASPADVWLLPEGSGQ